MSSFIVVSVLIITALSLFFRRQPRSPAQLLFAYGLPFVAIIVLLVYVSRFYRQVPGL